MKHGALMCYYSDFCQEYDKIVVIFLKIVILFKD